MRLILLRNFFENTDIIKLSKFFLSDRSNSTENRIKVKSNYINTAINESDGVKDECKPSQVDNFITYKNIFVCSPEKKSHLFNTKVAKTSVKTFPNSCQKPIFSQSFISHFLGISLHNSQSYFLLMH